mgnify:CR=1 FL=1
MNQNFRNFKKKFLIEELIILESNFWIVSLRPMQTTFGAMVISLKRETNSLSDLTTEESKNFGEILLEISKVNKKYLKTNLSNIFQLMLIDNYVHWHYFPRFKHDCNINKIYDPIGWPKMLDNLNKTIIEDDYSLSKIYKQIKSYYE